MVHANLIVNCPVTPENISYAHQLYDENFAGLGGKKSEKNRASGNQLFLNTKRFGTNKQVCDTNG